MIYEPISAGIARGMMPGEFGSLTTGPAEKKFVEKQYGAEVFYLKQVAGPRLPAVILPLCRYRGTDGSCVGTWPRIYSNIYTRAEKVIIDPVLLGDYLMDAYRPGVVKLLFWFPTGHVHPHFRQDPMAAWILELGTAGKLAPPDLLSCFSKKTRNQVRKSLGEGLCLKRLMKAAEFYPLCVKSTRRLGSKPKGITYFNNLISSFGKKLVIQGAMSGQKLAGVNIFYLNRDYLHLLFNFSDSAYWRLNVNDFLYYHTILEGFQRGARLIDFGPGMRIDRSHSHFKEGFGGQETKLYAYTCYRSRLRNFLYHARSIL